MCLLGYIVSILNMKNSKSKISMVINYYLNKMLLVDN